ncbi:MAG TPA: hypothetical protein VGU68_06685, partial [Ktedonobacteraceae bacterium]|nr:hypothetical protein [Ktedonobacteraceae bacterium]
MQQRSYGYEVMMMREPSNSQPNVDIHIYNAAPGWPTKKNHSLLITLAARVALFLRQAIFMLLGGFITYISKTKQKGKHKKAIEQSLQ